MKELQEYINESLSQTIFENLFSIFQKGLKPEEFCATVEDSISKGVKLKYKGLNGKEIENTKPIRVNIIFDNLIINRWGKHTFKDNAKKVATNFKGELDTETYRRQLEYYESMYKKIKTYEDTGMEKSLVAGGICVNIQYINDDNEPVYYTHTKDIIHTDSIKEFLKDIEKGRLDKDFIRAIYWSIFVAIFKPDSKWSTDNYKEFKQHVDPQIKANILKLAGSGADVKLKEWEQQQKDK